MTEQNDISIAFPDHQRRFLSTSLLEVFGGGATNAIQSVLGSETEAARLLEPEINRQVKNSDLPITLSSENWRTMYHAINAVIYGLGPAELQTCTGLYLSEIANINLKICGAVWGAYDKAQWSKVNRCCEP